jgi:hypothetical protein
MKTALLVLTGAMSVLAQPAFRKHNFSVGGGAGIPRGEIKPFLSTSPVLRIGYGWRFHRNFQADIGFDTVFHAAKIRDFVDSDFGALRIKDYQFMLPFGGRAIIPLGRVQLFAGGGPSWVRYQERIRQPLGNVLQIDCPPCRDRGGWGYYGVAGGSVALDRAQHFRLGMTVRVIRATTDGDAFGDVPAIQTKDHWINTAAEFTFSF